MIEPEHVHAVHQLLNWLHARGGSAGRGDVPRELEDALIVASTEPVLLACVTRHGPKLSGPVPPAVSKLARDLLLGDVLYGFREPVTRVRPVAGGVEVCVAHQPARLYPYSGGREPHVEVYAGPLPTPVHATVVTLTPAGELWLRRSEALYRMAAVAPIDHPLEPDATAAAVEAATMRPTITRAEAKQRLLEIHRRGEKWTSFEDMAGRIGCSDTTAHRAVGGDAALRKWATSAPGAPRAAALDDRLIDSTPQQRELSPEDEAALREFRERPGLGVDDLATFDAMSVERQLALVEAAAEQESDRRADRQVLGREA